MDNRALLFIILAAMLCVSILFVQSYSQLTELPNLGYDYHISVTDSTYEVHGRNGTLLLTSTNAVTAANYACNLGGDIYFAAGTYRVNATQGYQIYPKSNTTIRGAGDATLFVAYDGDGQVFCAGSLSEGEGYNLTNLSIRDIAITEDQATGDNGGIGFLGWNGTFSNIVVERVHVYDMTRDAVNSEVYDDNSTQNGITIRNNIFERIRSGVRWDLQENGTTINLRIQNNRIEDASNHGIILYNGLFEKTIIQGNIINRVGDTDTYKDGIYLGGANMLASGLQVIDNQIIDSQYCGLVLNYVVDGEISNNVIEGSNNIAVLLYYGNNNTRVVGNVVSNVQNSASYIRVTDGSNGLIFVQDNNLNNTAGYWLEVLTNGSTVYATGNWVYDLFDVSVVDTAYVYDNVGYKGSSIDGWYISLPSGSNSYNVTFPAGFAPANTNYAVYSEVDWNSNVWISDKTTTGFRLRFPVVTPDANRHVSYRVELRK